MTKQAIQVKNMTVAYDATPVVWNVTAQFNSGKLTAIIGPNGAGKSTLLNTTVGLIQPISGEAQFNINNTSVDWDFPATVLDVVVMGRYVHLGWIKRPKKADIQIAKEKLEQVGMLEFQDRQISQLSGGQRQRVFLARALAQEAEIYLLDEPFAGVDIKTEKVIITLLRKLVQQNKTVVVVHHDLQTVEEYFDEVLLMNKEVVAAGPTHEIFTEENIEETYRRDHDVQGVEVE